MYNFSILKFIWESDSNYLLITWKGKVLLIRVPDKISFKKEIDDVSFLDLTMDEAMRLNSIGVVNHIALNSSQLDDSINIPIWEIETHYWVDVPVSVFMERSRAIDSDDIDDYIETIHQIQNEG